MSAEWTYQTYEDDLGINGNEVVLHEGSRILGRICLKRKDKDGRVDLNDTLLQIRPEHADLTSFFDHIQLTKGLKEEDKRSLLEARDNFYPYEDNIEGLMVTVGFFYAKTPEEAEKMRSLIKGLGHVQSSLELAANVGGVEGIKRQRDEFLDKIKKKYGLDPDEKFL